IQTFVSHALYNRRLFCCLQSYHQSNLLGAYTAFRKPAFSTNNPVYQAEFLSRGIL
ncbi:hypothetical protein S83_047421, partial [Arachis hypogaea]